MAERTKDMYESPEQQVTQRARGEIVARDGKGTPTRFIGTHGDTTDRKRVEENLRDALAETERVNRIMQGRETRIRELKDEVEAVRRSMNEKVLELDDLVRELEEKNLVLE